MRAPSARVRPRPPAAKQVAANGPTAEAAAHATGRASERATISKLLCGARPKEEGVREGRVMRRARPHPVLAETRELLGP